MKRRIELGSVLLLSALLLAITLGTVRLSARAATLTATTVGPLDVVINEVAWGGTAVSAADEWIELYNTTAGTITLDGWRLIDDDTMDIPLSGDIGPTSYYLIERTDDTTISDISADWAGSFGSGGLSNDGEVLTLTNALDVVIDTANAGGGDWPGGTGSSGSPAYASMERVDPGAPDGDANWCTNDGLTTHGLDANGDPLNGTAKTRNSCYSAAAERAALAVAKSGPLTVTPGGLIAYRIALSNTGPASATGTVVTDVLPAAVTFVTQSGPFSFTRAGRAVIWQAGDVLSGSRHAITITGYVTETALGTLTNRVTATTATAEQTTHDNHAAWTTTVQVSGTAQLRINALHYYGYAGAGDEAVQLINLGDAPAALEGWYLDDDPASTGGLTFPAGATLLPGARIWCANEADAFAAQFGFKPDYEAGDTDPAVPEMSGAWPGYANAGDECALFDGTSRLIDALSYGDSANSVGWSGAAVQPWAPSGAFAKSGQILYRKLDQATGHPVTDTNTAGDWAQDPADHVDGRKIRYPGWDLEAFFHPVQVTETAHLTVAVAPDNAYEVVKEAIEGAQNSIWIEGYTFENAHLIDAVVAQAQAGRTVRVLLEGEKVSDQERWFCQRLVNSGGEAYFFHNDGDADIHDRYRFQHAKFIIVDGRLLIVGSENFNPSGLPNDDKSNGTWGRRGAFLLTDAPSVVARAQAIFERDLDTAHRDIVAWSASHPRYGAPTPGFAPTYVYTDWVTYTTRFSRPLHLAGEPLAFELLHSPENSLRDQGGLLGLVNRAGAGDTLLVEQLYERVHWGPTASTPASDPNPRLDAYVDAARRGARVRILLNGSADAGSVSENGETRAYVNDIAHDEGLDLELRLGDPAGRGIHNKMVLAEIDGRGTVHVGSINGSELSCKGNREMALQVQSDAAYTYLADVFDFDWHISGPLFLPLVLHGYAPPPPPVEYVVVSEVMYRPYLGEPPGNTEWVELYNPTTEAVDLTGWSVGDAAAPGEYGSGTYRFPAGATLPAQETLVVAQQAADVEFTPHFELALDPGRDDAGVPNLVPDGSWEGFGMALGNGGDEVILRDAGGADVDVVVWDDPSDDPVLKGTYPGVTPWQGLVATSWSLERRPIYYDSDDCSVDLIPRYPATPGSVP